MQWGAVCINGARPGWSEDCMATNTMRSDSVNRDNDYHVGDRVNASNGNNRNVDIRNLWKRVSDSNCCQNVRDIR
ncbi:hypothetical protein DV965_17430, partial [Staphylococcus pseudintermedius]